MRIWRIFSELSRVSATIVMDQCHCIFPCAAAILIRDLLDGNCNHMPSAIEHQMNLTLRSFAAERRNVFILDFQRLCDCTATKHSTMTNTVPSGGSIYSSGLQVLAEALDGLIRAVRDGGRKFWFWTSTTLSGAEFWVKTDRIGVRLSEDKYWRPIATSRDAFGRSSPRTPPRECCRGPKPKLSSRRRGRPGEAIQSFRQHLGSPLEYILIRPRYQYLSS